MSRKSSGYRQAHSSKRNQRKRQLVRELHRVVHDLDALEAEYRRLHGAEAEMPIGSPDEDAMESGGAS